MTSSLRRCEGHATLLSGANYMDFLETSPGPEVPPSYTGNHIVRRAQYRRRWREKAYGMISRRL